MNDSAAPKVLLATEDEEFSQLLINDMKSNDLDVQLVTSGNEALALSSELRPDVVVLDHNIKGGLSGIEVCAVMRSKPNLKNTPILVYAQEDQRFEQIKGTAGGMNDYLVKPFPPAELSRKVRSILRSVNPNYSTRMLEFEDIVMDLDNFRVTRAGKEVKIGGVEFKILQVLFENPRTVLSRDQIIQAVWGNTKEVDERTVDVHMNRIRTALKSHSDYIPLVKTIRSQGYCMRGAVVRFD